MSSIDTLIAIQDSKSISALQLNLPLDTTWETFIETITAASGVSQPFVLSAISDEGEETVVAREGEFELLKVMAASNGGQLVLSLAPAPEPEVNLPEEEQQQEKQQEEEEERKCPRAQPGMPQFGLGGLLQGVLGNIGLAQGDLPTFANSFMTGQPLPEELVAKMSQAIAAITGQDEANVKNNMTEALNRGQEMMTNCQTQRCRREARKQARDEAIKAREEAKKAKEEAQKASHVAVSATLARHHAICDSCENRIVGLRLKCLNCPDYDLCEACEGRNMKDNIHDASHLFVKIYKPVRSMAAFRPMPNFYVGCNRPRFMHGHRFFAQQQQQNAAEQEETQKRHEEMQKKMQEVAEQRKQAAEARHAAAKERAAAHFAARQAARQAHFAAQAQARQAAVDAKKEKMAKANSQDNDRLSAIEDQLLALTKAIAEERAARNA